MVNMSFIDSSLAPFIATFLFVFAVIYFLLDKSQITKNRNIDAVMALAIAFFAASFQPLVSALQGILPMAIVILAILFAIFFLRDAVDALAGKPENILTTAVELAVALALVGILWDDIKGLLPSSVNPNNVLWIVGLVIIILIFYVVNKQAAK